MKIFYLCIALTISNIAIGQVTVTSRPISSFQVTIEDLFHFDALNSSNQPVTVGFLMSVANENGQKVLELISNNYEIPVGLTNFNRNNLRLYSKNFISYELSNYLTRVNSFPTGEYEYCIQPLFKNHISDYTLMQSEYVGEHCFYFTVVPGSPLILQSPYDEDVISEKRPGFIWIPPMPIGTNPNIRYSLKLVHLLNTQNGEEGIYRNRPIYEVADYIGNTMPFPTTLNDLIEGERYAWQVEATLFGSNVGISDIWEFEIEKFPEMSTPKVLKVSGGLFYPTIDGYTSFYFVCNNTNDFDLKFKIKTPTGEEIASETDFDVYHTNYGLNQVFLKVDRLQKSSDKKYILEMIDCDGQLLFHRFELSKS